MSGNLARRRMTKFMPADFKLIEARQPAAQGHVRRVAGAHHLLRVLGARLALRFAGEPGDVGDPAPAGDAGRRLVMPARPRDPVMHERARPRVRVGRRRRHPPAAAGPDAQHPGQRRHQDPRGGAGGAGAGGGRQNGSAHRAGEVQSASRRAGEQGRFSMADNAVAVVGTPTRKSKPSGVQVASNDAMMSDVADDASSRAIEVAQIGNLLHPLSRGHPVCRKGLARRKAHRPRHPRRPPETPDAEAPPKGPASSSNPPENE